MGRSRAVPEVIPVDGVEVPEGLVDCLLRGGRSPSTERQVSDRVALPQVGPEEVGRVRSPHQAARVVDSHRAWGASPKAGLNGRPDARDGQVGRLPGVGRRDDDARRAGHQRKSCGVCEPNVAVYDDGSVPLRDGGRDGVRGERNDHATIQAGADDA